MARSVKRSYDGEQRKARSEETRQRILEVARRLITVRGYRAATVAAMADEAGVHIDTVYALVGRKPAILRELIEQAISGTDRAVPPDERDYVRRMEAEPDPARKLALYAAAMRAIQSRMAPLYLALRDAAATEPDAHAVWQQIAERRVANMRRLVRGLGALRPGVTVDEAADIIWSTASSEFFVLLTGERRWTLEHYESWLAATWQRLLL